MPDQMALGVAVLELQATGKAKLLQEADDAAKKAKDRLSKRDMGKMMADRAGVGPDGMTASERMIVGMSPAKVSPMMAALGKNGAGIQQPPALNKLWSETQTRIGDLKKQLDYTQSNTGKRALQEEAAIRDRLTKAERLATGEVTHFSEALSRYGIKGGAAGLAGGVTSLIAAAFAAGGQVQSSMHANVALSNPALAEQYDRASNNRQAVVGRIQEKDVAGMTEKERRYADALEGRRQEGKISKAEKVTLTLSESLGLQKQFVNWLPEPDWVKQGAEKHKGAATGAAYDSRLGQRFGGEDIYGAVGTEALREPMRSGVGGEDSGSTLKDIRDWLFKFNGSILAPTGSPQRTAMNVGGWAYDKISGLFGSGE